MDKSREIIKEGRAKGVPLSKIKATLDSNRCTRPNGKPWSLPEISRVACKMGLRSNAKRKSKRAKAKDSSISVLLLVEDIITSTLKAEHKEHLIKRLMNEG